METQVFSCSSSSSSTLLHTIIIFIILITGSSAEGDDHDERLVLSCRRAFSCGEHVVNISYPLWAGNSTQECAAAGSSLELKCHQPQNYPTLHISNQTFRVLSVNTSDHTLRIARNNLWEDHHIICPDGGYGYNNSTPFLYIPPPEHDDERLELFYDCAPYNGTALLRNRLACNINDGVERTLYYANESSFSSSVELRKYIQGCQLNITLPVVGVALEEFRRNESITLLELLHQGFHVVYRVDSFSGSSINSYSFSRSSINSSQDNNTTANSKDRPDIGLKIGIGVGAAAFGAIVMCIFFSAYYYRRLKKHSLTSSMVSGDVCSYPTSVADLENAGNYCGVHVFNYDELLEATNNFDSSKELGDGGFGTVYKGKLRDGRVVAIKRLYENNYKRVEQFMNEIEILTHLRHRNLVSLYGCNSYRGRELLLVYEYIPNGTVADHLHGERARPGLPSWTTRLNIAIESAGALAYLHASDVIHRDVKTNNILLDNNFCVKVADFGLSRSKPTNVTHVSTAPQGTPGYVDPEYHQYYHLTDKSDVYSFGVVLIELISSKPAVDITRHRHEINLSNMAINKIQNHALHELVDPYLGFESDCKVRTMITAVAELAFRCLQLGREMRPSMKDVLEVLQGIQRNHYHILKAEEMDIPADDVLLLKNDALPSPESESVGSRSEKHNASG